MNPLKFLGLIGLLCLIACNPDSPLLESTSIPLKLDQEKMLSPHKALNSGTQSVNRYHSNLRDLANAQFDFDPENKLLRVQLHDSLQERYVRMENIDIRYMVPLLPYEHEDEIDAFDKANLLLAEFARNGISLSHQDENSVYGYFRFSEKVFNQEGEYFFAKGEISPNPGVEPLRMSLVNNCLDPGLWEVNASDAVGEMYHAWMKLPDDFYFDLIRSCNEIQTPGEDIKAFIEAQSFHQIAVDLDRLRDRGALLQESTAEVATHKKLGGYSSQDSRRKVQRGFYEVALGGQPMQIDSFGQLGPDHLFRLHAFIPPGIYDHTQKFEVKYQPDWEKVEIYEVSPKTSYGSEKSTSEEAAAIEIVLSSTDGKRQMVAGNIPLALLYPGADFQIPAFGAGVLQASELVERRYIRLKDGPLPAYAYLGEVENGQLNLLNNHEVGYEQIFIRPLINGSEMKLRFTVVSYERIVDLLEFEIPVNGELKERILRSSKSYQPPAYEVYQDNNLI